MMDSVIESIRSNLLATSGGLLHTVIRDVTASCPVCATPTNAGSKCIPCGRLRHEDNLADRVGLLIYGVKGTQLYWDLSNYKGNPPQEAARSRIASILGLGLVLHRSCLETVAGHQLTGICVVPSSRDRPVLRHVLQGMLSNPLDLTPLVYSGSGDSRVYDPSRYKIDRQPPPGGHVLVIDDSWVSGFHAQSVATSLKRSGATQVSILCVARVLDPEWPDNKPFIQNRLDNLRYDPYHCPWTNGNCPK